MQVCAAYGGSSKWEQVQDLKQGAEIVVATPVCCYSNTNNTITHPIGTADRPGEE